MKGNVIQMNTLHLNSVRLNGIGKVQSVSLKGGSTEDPVFPPVEPPVEPEPTPTYTLSASVTNGKVSAKRNGSAVNLPFTANEGDTIVVSVTPNDGYAFEGWADGNTDNPRTITMNADVALSAQCVEVVQPPAKDYIQFEDAEVERVLMSKGVSSDGVGITMEDAAAVTSISTWFKGNTAIQSFDEFRYFTGVKSLDASAFEGCSNLARLPIEHIEIFKNDALNGCTSLYYDELNLSNCTSFGTGVLYGVKVKKLSLGKVTTLYQGGSSKQNYGDKTILEELVIPIGVVSIPRYCFEGYSNAHIVLHEGITSIGSLALYGTATRGDVVLPNLTSMEGSVFAGSKIKRVLDLGSITNLGNRTFNDCDSLEYINMPATLTEIGQYTFSSNATPMAMVVRASTPPTLGTTFTSSTITAIYVPDASLEAYKTATNWNQYADRIHPLSEIEGSLVFYDKLVGDGYSYIRTDLMPNSFDNYEFDVSRAKNWNKFVFGSKSNKMSVGAVIYSGNQTFYLYTPNSAASTEVAMGNGERMHRGLRTISLGDGKYRREEYRLHDGNEDEVRTLIASTSIVDETSTMPLLVLACNVTASSNNPDRLYDGAIYSFIVTDSRTNEVRMSLKPCTWNGEAGMWDEVNGKFYGNASTSGEFSVANDE